MMVSDWTFAPLKRHHYGVVYADPAWTFEAFSGDGGPKNPSAHYQCMPLSAIQRLPVSALVLPDSVCVMWATSPLLDAAIDTLKCWGFRYVACAPWAKQSKTGKKWAFGTGYIFRNAAEFILVGTRGDPDILSRSVRNLVVAPVREHSRKPDEVRTLIKALFPGPYCELFARQTTPGWDAWGNQIGKFDEASS